MLVSDKVFSRSGVVESRARVRSVEPARASYRTFGRELSKVRALAQRRPPCACSRPCMVCSAGLVAAGELFL
jgi:hypothetical protein